MKELAERVFTRLPSYLPDLAALVARPKRTIIAKTGIAKTNGETAGGAGSHQHDTPKAPLHDALIFVGITIGLGFLLQAPTLPPESDFLLTATGMAAFKVIAILLFSAVIHGCFRLLGGKGAFLRTLAAYIYAVSPLYLALVVMSLIAQGLVRAYDPELGLLVRSNPLYFLQEPEALARFEREALPLATAMLAVNWLSNLVMIVWFIICLGAFRHIHGVTRGRSALACVLIFIAWWPYAMILFFLIIGIFGPVAPPLT